MKHTSVVFCFIGFLFLLPFTPVHAFNRERRGFVLDFACGAGYEFYPRLAICGEVMYTAGQEPNIRSLSILTGLKILLY